MKTFMGVLRLIFMSARITCTRLHIYAEDHLQRLITNNDNHQYDPMIAETQIRFKEFSDALNAEFSLITLREAATKNVDALIENFKNMVRRKKATIESFFAKDTIAYFEFFPDGLRTYTHATKGTIEQVMSHFNSTLANHQGELGVVLLNEFVDQFANYIAARQAQLMKKAEVSAQRTLVREKRKALAIQLQKNVYALGVEFADNMERAYDFFDFSLLYHPANHVPLDEEQDEYLVTIPPKTIVDSRVALTGTEKIMLYNEGDGPLKAYTTDDQHNLVVPPEAMIILPDEEKVVEPGMLGALANRFLMIVNEDVEDEGRMVIYFL